MTSIDFHVNLADKLAHACRLVRKAQRAGRRLVVCGEDPALLARFDQALWTFSALDFVPHVFAHDVLAAETPVVLAAPDARGETLPHHDVLVNLGGAQPGFFSSFERMIELVGTDEADRAAARERFRFYRDRGYALQTFDAAGAAG